MQLVECHMIAQIAVDYCSMGHEDQVNHYGSFDLY